MDEVTEYKEISGSEISGMKLLKQGSEARVYTCIYLGQPTVVKERFKKNYRHPELDEILTKDRIKNEARSIVRCKTSLVRTPALYLVDFVRRRIYMEHIEKSITVKEFIIHHIKDDAPRNKLDAVAILIGKNVRKLHESNIIHGDLTTSNMLLVPPHGKEEDADWLEGELELAMIDFGLSYNSSAGEDKGVDLYVLERAITSTHNDYPILFDLILASYKSYCKKNIGETLNRFEDVRARGRKRTMVG